MHKFIKKCGTVVEVERFIQSPKLSDGYVWQCESTLGHVESVWRAVEGRRRAQEGIGGLAVSPHRSNEGHRRQNLGSLLRTYVRT